MGEGSKIVKNVNQSPNARRNRNGKGKTDLFAFNIFFAITILKNPLKKGFLNLKLLNFDIFAKTFASVGVAELSQRFCFDLSDTFACNAEKLAHFFKCSLASVVHSEAKS